ncbi:hypothetical protein BTUL_0031g00430 [Botrytis tulipae]|uniref:Uncharacterized protein n=1 Tax=Botrytis tulipae TaxID=87230 RepID=A0A4Z1F4Z0_9HELO|nr:hypothetical protein BTUL_0031g00430 [Botrytis tulipae]
MYVAMGKIAFPGSGRLGRDASDALHYYSLHIKDDSTPMTIDILHLYLDHRDAGNKSVKPFTR